MKNSVFNLPFQWTFNPEHQLVPADKEALFNQKSANIEKIGKNDSSAKLLIQARIIK